MKNPILTITCLLLTICFSLSGYGQKLDLIYTEPNNLGNVVHLKGDTVLISQSWNSVRIAKIVNQNSFKTIGTFSSGSDSEYLTVDGDYAFYLQGTAFNLTIADISNRQSPIIKSTLRFNGVVSGVCRNENALYVTYADTLFVLDMSNAQKPVFKDSIHVDGGYSIEIKQNDTLIHVGTRNGLKTFSVSNPFNPILISSFGGAYSRLDVDSARQRVICAKGGNAGFDVIDFSNPASPQLLFSGGAGLTGSALKFFDDKVYQGNFNSATPVVAVYDISVNPPILIDSTLLEAGMGSIEVIDSMIITIDYANLSLMKLSFDVSSRKEHEDLDIKISTYPNPSNSLVQFNLNNDSKTEPLTLSIYNSVGSLIGNPVSFNQSYSLNVEAYNSGTYHFIVRISENEYQRGTFIVNDF